MDLSHHPRWRQAVARNRARFERGGPAERARVRDELDALRAELLGERHVPEDALVPSRVGTRYASLRALTLALGPAAASD